MLDTRLHGRDLQAALPTGQSEVPADDPVVCDPTRSLLGFDQERWLARELSDSKRRGTAWRVLGQQVMLAQLSLTAGQTVRNPDQWDGYAPARERLLKHLATGKIDNNVILSGDIHSTWCADITANPWDPATYDPPTGRGVLGVEFTSPAITSPGSARDPQTSVQRAALYAAKSPHLKHVDTFHRGYGVLELTPQRARSEIYYIDTVDKRDAGQRLGAAFVSESGNNKLEVG
jgi:alkaline phosphatase D